MIKIIKKYCTIIFCVSFLSAQESLFWEVSDPIVNSDFIEAYINRLIEVDKFEENSIQASFSIIVQMDIEDNEVELKKLKAKDNQMGQYLSFDMSEVEKMDPIQLNILISREYKWNDVSRRDLSELEQFSNVDNVFKERSFKDARDAFWWSTSQISVSSANRIFIRQKSGSLAFRLEQGFSELGLSRQLSENLLMGLSNDIVSSYLIIPGNTRSVSNGIGHPLEGNYGFGFKFDTHKLGGQVNYMDVDGVEYSSEGLYSRKHLILPSSSGVLYWSNTFQINRNVDSNYGNKIKDQKKEKEKASNLLKKSRIWTLSGKKKVEGTFIEVTENNLVKLQIDKDEKAHKIAKKGRKWTTNSGSEVKASLVEKNKNSITLNRSKDNFTIVLKISDLSQEDKDFLEKLQWDGDKIMSVSLENFSSEDQSIIRISSGVVRARSGKGKELKISQPFASMRLKAGLSFVQFLHGNVNEDNQVSVTDRVIGSDAIGIYAKVEAVTDDKKSKAYLQFNVSGSGFKAVSSGIEYNAYRMFNLGLDFTLYPNNSSIEFQDNRENSLSKWNWYPGDIPNSNGEGGGTFFISPYITINF
tara:strand:- start:60 stop:1811 length:1752 start_codon:yes stop_codon:yes gene_type:complete